MSEVRAQRFAERVQQRTLLRCFVTASMPSAVVRRVLPVPVPLIKTRFSASEGGRGEAHICLRSIFAWSTSKPDTPAAAPQLVGLT
jgi:hypothetical protein